MSIKSWKDVDKEIEYIGLQQIQRDRLEGKLNEKIAATKELYAPEIELHDKAIAATVEQLEAFCQAHRPDMQQAKQNGGLVWKGAFGKVAFRKCPPSIAFLVKKTEKIVAALKARKLTTCVRTVEEPNKEAMALLDADTLAAVGARRGADEKFEVKPDYTVIEAKEDAT